MKQAPTLFHHVRKAAGIRQIEAAERLKVTQATVSRWDTGATKAPEWAVEALRALIVAKAA